MCLCPTEFCHKALVSLLCITLAFYPTAASFASDDHGSPTAAQEQAPKIDRGLCSTDAWEKMNRENPIIQFSNMFKRIKKRRPGGHAGRNFKGGYNTYTGTYYYWVPTGYKHLYSDPNSAYDPKNPNKPARHERNKQEHFRVHFDRLIQRAIYCMGATEPGGAAPDFVNAMDKYLSEEIPRALVRAQDGHAKDHPRTYTQELHDHMEAMEALRGVYRLSLAHFSSLPALSKAASNQILARNKALKDGEFPAVTKEMEARLIELHNLLEEARPPITVASIPEGPLRALWSSLYGQPGDLADELFGFPLAAQMRDLVVRGKAPKYTGESPYSFKKDSDNYLFSGFPEGSEQLKQLRSMLVQPSTKSLAVRYQGTYLTPGETPFFWQDGDPKERKKIADAFEKISEGDRAKVLEWIDSKVTVLNQAKAHGDWQNYPSTAMTRELFLRVGRRLEAKDHGDSAPVLSEFDEARSQFELEKLEKKPEHQSDVYRWNRVQSQYQAITGKRLPKYASWRYYLIHPAQKDMLDRILAAMKDTRHTESLEELMQNLSHTRIVDEYKSLGVDKYFGDLFRVIQNAGITPEVFEEQTGVDMLALQKILSRPDTPTIPWFEEYSKVMGVGDDYKGERVRHFLQEQMLALKVLKQFQTFTRSSLTSEGLGNTLQRWLGSKSGGPTIADDVNRQEQAFARLITSVKDFYASGDHEDMDPNALASSMRTLVHRSGLRAKPGLTDYLVRAGPTLKRTLSLPAGAKYWQGRDSDFGALSTLLQTLDEVGHDPMSMAVVHQGADRFHPDIILGNFHREREAKAAILNDILHRGLVPPGSSPLSHFESEFARVRDKVLQDPRQFEDGPGWHTIAHRGVPATSRQLLMQLMLPENEPHLETVERMAANTDARERSKVADTREHAPSGLYKALSLGASPGDLAESLAGLDPEAHKHLACFQQPQFLQNSIVERLVQHQGHMTAQTAIELELLAGSQLWLEETGSCAVMDAGRLISAFYVPEDRPTLPSGLLTERMESLRRDLVYLAADQALRGIRPKFRSARPKTNMSREEREALILKDLVENDGELSKQGKIHLASIAATDVNDPMGKWAQYLIEYVDVQGNKRIRQPPPAVQARMDELESQYKTQLANTLPPEMLARAIVTEWRFSNENEQNRFREEFQRVHPDHWTLSKEDLREAIRKYAEEYKSTGAFKEEIDSRMTQVRDIGTTGKIVSQVLPQYEDRFSHSYEELDDGSKAIEKAMQELLQRKRTSAYSRAAEAQKTIQDTSIELQPNPEILATRILKTREDRDRAAGEFRTQQNLVGMILGYRTMIFHGDAGNPLSLASLQDAGKHFREQMSPRKDGKAVTSEFQQKRKAEKKLPYTLATEVVDRMEGFLATLDVNTDDKNVHAVVQQSILAAQVCAFGRDSLQRQSACHSMTDALLYLNGDEDASKIADFVSNWKKEGENRVLSEQFRLARAYVDRIDVALGGLTDTEKRKLEVQAQRYIRDVDARIGHQGKQRDERRSVAAEITDKYLQDRLTEIPPGEREMVRRRYLTTVEYLLDLGKISLANVESLAALSHLPFAKTPAGDSPQVTRLLDQASEDWEVNPALATLSRKELQRRFDEAKSESATAHAKEAQSREEAIRAFTSLGFQFDGISLNLNDSPVAWENVMNRSSIHLTRGGWTDLGGKSTQGRGKSDAEARVARLKDLQEKLGALDEHGVPVQFDMGPEPGQATHSSYSSLMDRLMDANFRGYQYTDKWNPLSDVLGSRLVLGEHGQITDIDFDSLESLKRSFNAYDKRAEYLKDRHLELSDDLGSVGHNLYNVGVNLGNMWGTYEDELAEKVNSTWTEYRKMRSLKDLFGGIIVTDDGKTARQVNLEDDAEGKMILLREAEDIQRAMANVEMINEIGWTVIIAVGTFGVGAYLTTMANAARLVATERYVMAGTRMVFYGGRTLKVGRWGERTAKMLVTANRLNDTKNATRAIRILKTINHLKTAGKQGLWGVGFSSIPYEGMALYEHWEISGKMKEAMRDYDNDEFDPDSFEYRQKYGDLWAHIDTDGDGIPDWHEKDENQEWEYKHPGIASSWDTAARGFTTFAGMTLAAPVSVPFLPARLQGLNRAVLSPGLHVGAGQLGTELLFDVRKGQKEVGEAFLDAGLTALIMMPSAGVANYSGVYNWGLPGSKTFRDVPRLGRMSGTRLWASGATAGTMWASHHVGEPIRLDIKEALGYDVSGHRMALEQNGENRLAFATQMGQHVLFSLMMTGGGQNRHIQKSLRAKDANIPELIKQWGPRNVNNALYSLPKHEIESGFEPPSGKVPTTSDIVARDGTAKTRQPTENEPLLRHLAQQEGLTVDTYAFSLALVKAGVKPHQVDGLFPGQMLQVAAGAKGPGWWARRSGKLGSIAEGIAPPMQVPGRTPKVVPARPGWTGKLMNWVRTKFNPARELAKTGGTAPEPGPKTKVKMTPTEVMDNQHSDVGRMAAAYYGRMLELATHPVRNGAPKKALTPENLARLTAYRQQLAREITANPSLLGHFTRDAPIVNPLLADAIHTYASRRLGNEVLYLKGTRPPANMEEIGGPLFAAYLARPRTTAEAPTLDYTFNRFMLGMSRGEIRLTEADWVRYERAYGRPRPAWIPTPGKVATAPPTFGGGPNGLPGPRPALPQ